MHEYPTDLTQMMKIWELVSYKDFRQAPAAMMEKISSSKKPSEVLSAQDTRTTKDFFFLAQDFSTRLLGAWGKGLVFVEII